MPLDSCHPEAPHKKLRIPEWYVSSLMLDRALDAIVRRVKKLDRDHDIPYLAGYSQDVFLRLQRDFLSFASHLGISFVQCIPIKLIEWDIEAGLKWSIQCWENY